MTLFAALWLTPEMQSRLGFWLGAIVLIYFGVIFIIDFEFRLILHMTSWFGVFLGIIVGWYLHGPVNMILGGIAGYGIMFLLYKLGAIFGKIVGRARGQSVDEVALGFGDVNLMGVLGLMIGFPFIFIVILMTIFIAGFFSIFYVLVKIVTRQFKQLTAIPYGPFLILAASMALFFPEKLSAMLQVLWPAFF